MRVLDLSVALDAGTQVYPGDPVLQTAQATTTDVEGYNVLHLRMGSQTGTHVDAPYHVVDDGLRIDELPLTRFIARLVLVDLRGLAPRTCITWEHLAPVAARLGPDVALVLHTGWAARRGSDGYFDHPFLDVRTAEEVLSRGVRTLGLDAPSIDETLLDGRRPALPVHHLVAAVDGVVVENLTGLESIDLAEPWLSVLPLLLSGGDGAPCRAVAMELRP